MANCRFQIADSQNQMIFVLSELDFRHET